MKKFFIKPFSYYDLTNPNSKKLVNIFRDPGTYVIAVCALAISYLVNSVL
jgi:hypothetical protein